MESPPHRFFHVNSKQFKSNPNLSEKYSDNTEVSKKKKKRNRQMSLRQKTLQTSKTATRKCSDKFEKTSRKTSRTVYSS